MSVVLVALVTITIALSYYWLNEFYSYWKKRGIVSTKPWFIFGDIGSFLLGRKHLAYVIDDIYHSFQNEKFVGFFGVRKPILLLRDPDLIQRVLVKDFKYFHDRDRRNHAKDEQTNPLFLHLLNLTGHRWQTTKNDWVKFFTTAEVKSMYESVQECGEETTNIIQQYTSKSKPVDVNKISAKYMDYIIGKCVYGLKIRNLLYNDHELNEIRTVVEKQMHNTLVRIFTKLFNIESKIIPEHIETFFYDLSQESKQYQELKYETGDRYLATAANLFLMFTDTSEIGTSTLIYTLYELAMNPDCQEKLRDEIKTFLKEHDGNIEFDHLNELQYTAMIVSEILRKYNTIPLGRRICTQPYQIPDTSIVLPAGTRIMIPIHSIHHDPKYYPNPNKFDPERFRNDNRQPSTATYIPFGCGPRLCTGWRLALLEMKYFLLEIVSKYRISVCDETKALEFKNDSFLFYPKHKVYLSFTEVQ